ncbi:hypothetical protein [Deinococcus cellulosilyticus]|uniref:Uncharacterized protein n=1 Tax=Deinococcus cellulosilyticus (strain DSM 18568 / NBRC 106333 / KACC 11606 / 5516J-15) TaxID=1223518 RepID=A0A511NAI1_DEIC1|nr:hypothetical protein [Deinococcus cellulosilyticus]GEM49371.1 hypothetical protein DC3_50060 [Deinococcus cellulosilyticus NBRC 106333 = KACC 11606]
MKLIDHPYSRTLPLMQRRALIVVFGSSALLAQLLLPSVQTESVAGALPLLLIPLALVCHYALMSEVWVWNRLFRPDRNLDEYERHTRNTFIAQAYNLNRFLIWISVAAFMVGGGLLRSVPSLNVFAGASFEVAVLVFFAVVMGVFEGLPRLIAAWIEDIPEA